jgi:hypothetical protein
MSFFFSIPADASARLRILDDMHRRVATDNVSANHGQILGRRTQRRARSLVRPTTSGSRLLTAAAHIGR